MHADDPAIRPGSPSVFDFDVLFKEVDRLYADLARGCGLSDCAYWVMYALEAEGGVATQRVLVGRLGYTKQTINSAVRSLARRGLVSLGFSEGSRLSKDVALTEEGRAFVRERVRPAMDAEVRAFATLSAADQGELLRLATAYAGAVREQVEAMGLEAGEAR